MTATARFGTVALQTFSDAQVAFITSVEHDLDSLDSLGDVQADYAEELAALASEGVPA